MLSGRGEKVATFKLASAGSTICAIVTFVDDAPRPRELKILQLYGCAGVESAGVRACAAKARAYGTVKQHGSVYAVSTKKHDGWCYWGSAAVKVRGTWFEIATASHVCYAPARSQDT